MPNAQDLAQGQSILAAAGELKRIQDIGLTNEADVKEYLQGMELLVENMAEYLAKKEEGDTMEITALKSSIEEVFRNVKKGTKEVHHLTLDEIKHNIGKSLNAMARGDKAELYSLGNFPQRARQKDEWDKASKWEWNPQKTQLEYKGIVQKADLGSPLEGSTNDTGQYVINPIYERELIRQAAETSDMMQYVRHLPMLAPTHSWPVLASNGFTITWKSAYSGASAMYSEAGKPAFGARETMTAQTATGYIPWFDEFEDDMQLNTSLGELFMEAWAVSYATEFDQQCLTSTTPFTGLLEADDTLVYRTAGTAPGSIDLDDLIQAPLMIPRKEREGGYWIMNETVKAHLISKRDAIGNYLIWQPPMGDDPSRIAYHQVIEARVMPEFGDIGADEAFIAYCVPNRRIWHGDRAGLEVKYFEDTSYALEYGELFVRFRKRDAFKIIQPELAVLIKTRA